MKTLTSVEVGRAALRLALTSTREEEQVMRCQLEEVGMRSVAVDFGGQFLPSIIKILEHAVVAAQRQHVVSEDHLGEGAVVGAAQDALEQIKVKCMGLNVGGKIGIARFKEHLCVAIYCGVGVMHLNEVTVGMGHRSLPDMEK